MMERTLFELTQAISAYRIGVIHAPSQYGRSTIIQTLAQVTVFSFHRKIFLFI